MNTWGITNQQADTLYQEGGLKKAQLKNLRGETFDVYYKKAKGSFDNQEILAANNMSAVLGEWMEFYTCRVENLKEQCGIENAVPIITVEECFACGL